MPKERGGTTARKAAATPEDDPRSVEQFQTEAMAMRQRIERLLATTGLTDWEKRFLGDLRSMGAVDDEHGITAGGLARLSRRQIYKISILEHRQGLTDCDDEAAADEHCQPRAG